MVMRAVVFTMTLDPAADKQIGAQKSRPSGRLLSEWESRKTQAQPFWLIDST